MELSLDGRELLTRRSIRLKEQQIKRSRGGKNLVCLRNLKFIGIGFQEVTGKACDMRW
jgi:hypothetical protein